MNRRELLMGGSLKLAAAALALTGARSAQAAGDGSPLLTAQLQACSPSDPLQRLQEGNARFVRAWRSASGSNSAVERMRLLEEIWEDNCQIAPLALAQGQKPFAATLSCADSRVDPAWLFACGAGELFQVRSAGNTAFNDGIASLEYAVTVLETPLIVVMGHSSCGAVQAALGSEPLTPLLEELVAPIRANLRPGDNLTQAIQGNARCAASDLRQRSEVLRDAAAAGTLRIVSAYFDIGSGRVTLI